MSIKKKNYYESYGGGNLKTLLDRERELFKDPRWIGWHNIDLNKYCKEDRMYLRGLIRN